MDPIDRHATYRRDLTQVETDLAELEKLRTEAQGAVGPPTFTPQIELGIRVNSIVRDWLHEQIEATTDDNRRPGGANQ